MMKFSSKESRSDFRGGAPTLPCHRHNVNLRMARAACVASLLMFGHYAFAQTTVTGPNINPTTTGTSTAAPNVAKAGSNTSVRVMPGAAVVADDGATTVTAVDHTIVSTNTSPTGDTTTTTTQAPNGVEIQIGIASRVGGGSISNYNITNGVLSLANLGRATPQLLTGIGFSCDTSTTTTTATTTPSSNSKGRTIVSKARTGDTNAFCNSWAQHFGAFISAQIGTGSSPTISGYTFGVTYPVGKFLRLLAGYSLTPSKEISPGFANAASQYVSKNPGLFPGIDATKLSSNAFGAFDGIQTTSTPPSATAAPTSTIFYPGSVTETNYRSGFTIGIALPINIYSLLGGNNKSN